MAQNMFHLGKWSMYTWEECVFCCHCVEGSVNFITAFDYERHWYSFLYGSYDGCLLSISDLWFYSFHQFWKYLSHYFLRFYFLEREREQKREKEKQSPRWVETLTGHGTLSQDPKSIAWPKVRHLMDWATPEPLS